MVDVKTALATARSLAEDLLVAAGVPSPAAAQQAELLLVAEAKGMPSHGLLRLPRLLRRLANGTASPTNTGKHHWQSPCSLTVDGEQGLGPVVALRALEAVVPAAERHGVAVCSITNNNHLGMLGFYAGRIAERGLVCLGMTTSEALVHPWGGTEAMLGTNPFALGVPAEPHPLVLDMATSQISMGKVHDHAIRGVPLEPGWALDAEGNPTIDPVAAKDGSIAPFGGPKGYGLGLGLGAMITFLTGAAYGTAVGGTLDDDRPSNKGDLFILLSGAHSTSAYLEQVRGSRRADPATPVAVPGDGARARYQESVAEGIEIADDLWRELTRLATSRPEAALAE